MYILELLTKLLKPKASKYEQSIQFEADILGNDEENCEHLFLPLDNSQTHFACKYCGIIVPKEKLKDRNIFRNNPQN